MRYDINSKKLMTSVLKTILDDETIAIWNYDILSGKGELYPDCNIDFLKKIKHLELPGTFLNNGYIDEKSREDFLKIHEDIKFCKDFVECDILLHVEYRTYWTRLRYIPLERENGSVTKAVGVSKIITRQKEAAISYSHSLKFRSAVMDDVIATCEINLTKRKIVCIDDLLYPLPPSSDFEKMFNKELLLNCMLEHIPYEEDAVKMRRSFSVSGVLRALDRGENVLKQEVRFKKNDGSIIWAKAITRTIKDPDTQDLIVYGLIKNIDREKRSELSLRSRAERDSVTGFYNQETLSAVIDEMLLNGVAQKSECAMLIFDIDNYLSMITKYGYEKSQYALKQLSQLIDAKFPVKKIPGRVDGDSFVIFVYDNPVRADVLKIAEEIRQVISIPYLFQEMTMTVSGGVCFLECEKASYQELYEKADTALKEAKARGKDNVIEYENIERPIVFDNRVHAISNFFEENVQEEDFEDTQKDVLLTTALALSSPESFDTSVRSVLRSIAEYYDAEEAFIVEADEHRLKIEHYYFWSKNPVDLENPENPIDDIGNTVYKTWMEALKEQDYFAVADIDVLKGSFPKEHDVLLKWAVESFVIISIMRNGKCCGYLGINNPGRRFGNIKLLKTLTYYISNEIDKQRIIDYQEYLKRHDKLTGLYSKSEFIKYRFDFSSDSVISVGFIDCRIYDLKSLNLKYGHVYGDSLLTFVADAIKNVFEDAYAYRFSGDEFVIISENCTAESFYAKIDKFRNFCKETFEGLFLVGYSWSDYEISLDELKEHADDRLMQEMQQINLQKTNGNCEKLQKQQKKLENDIAIGKYKVYLQPKANMKSGMVEGAEALIRFEDGNGSIIGPDKFLPELEQNGLIKCIDLFVFNEVNKVLERWQEEGKTLYKISLNFSRSTMMDEHILDAIDVIQKKYTVPRSFIEIEMTETMGNIDEDILVRIGKKIARMGFSLSLDDFGARYSNLSILSLMPFDVLKLDKSLVHDVAYNSKLKIIVEHFLNICRNLGIQSIAEGVEVEEQYDILKTLGCDAVQGYIINKPLNISEFERRYIE